MSEKEIETIITEILASSQPIGNRGKYVNSSGQMQADRRQTLSERPRKRLAPRNPLYTSLRLIILGLVILLVPLLFSGKKVHPPSPTITGSINTVTPYDAYAVSRAPRA